MRGPIPQSEANICCIALIAQGQMGPSGMCCRCGEPERGSLASKLGGIDGMAGMDGQGGRWSCLS
jgi:hypothetical protein